VFLPTKRSSASVDALDVLLSADGTLNQLWLDASPAKESLAAQVYSLPENRWPERLRNQWRSLVEFRTTNPHELPRESGSRWS